MTRAGCWLCAPATSAQGGHVRGPRAMRNHVPRSAAARCKEMAKTKTKSNRRSLTQIPQVGMLYGDSLHLIEPLLIRLLINGNAREDQAALCARTGIVFN